MAVEALDNVVPIRALHRFPDDIDAIPEGSHVDGRDARKPTVDSADYVIIGSGAAGSTVAHVLSEAGFSVILLEEGPWIRTREFGEDLRGAMGTLFRGAGTFVATGRSFLLVMQGSCVGGSTTVNSAIAWRAPEKVIDGWSTEFGLGDHVNMRVLEPHYAALDEELHVHAVRDEALGGNNALFQQATKKLGFESHVIRRYDVGCEGSAGCLTGCRTGKKLGMNITYIPKTLHAGGKIYSSTKVDRVETNVGRAVEVRATMKSEAGPVPLRVRARRGVFVAASAVQTPGVLRRSGLRAKAIGRHFQSHPGVSIMAALDRPVHMDFGASQGFNSLAFLESDRIKLESLSLPPELASARLPGVGREMMQRFANYAHMAAWAVVIRSEAEGSVGEMFGSDQIRFSLTQRDMANARKGLKKLCEMMFAVGAKEIYPGAHGMPAVMNSPDQLKLWDDAPTDSRAYTMMMSHMFGAARMGPDPRTSAVGTDFQSHEMERLFVVDSSVFPTNLGVNPQHTIMAMARLCATRIAERPALPY